MTRVSMQGCVVDLRQRANLREGNFAERFKAPIFLEEVLTMETM